MTAVYNVNRSVDDPFYRYKMPAIIAKVEGKGNGIKTVIPNMPSIAKALDRPPSYPTKYFGIELGAQTKVDKKNDRYIVNGAHTAEDLQNTLDGFIQKFVLCPSCDNPETDLQVSKKSIRQVCAACGHTGPLKHVTHRLYNYIVTHPPTPSSKGKKKAAEADKKKKASETEEPEEVGFEGDIEAPELDENRDDDEEEWTEDISAEAIRRREESQLTGAVSKLIASADADRPMDERVDIFHDYVKERMDHEPFPIKEVLDKATVLDVFDAAGIVLVEVLLDTKNLIQRLQKYQAVFQHFCVDRSKVQRRVLNGIEMRVKESGLPLEQMPNILNALYQLDIIDEDNFFSWHKKVSKRYVDKETSAKIREASKPFIDWLREAESEEEESEEEAEASDAAEDGVEVQFASPAAANNHKTPAAPQTQAVQENGADDDDDIDIDAI